MVSVSSVMTVMVMHGKMETLLMENAHTTTDLRMKETTQLMTTTQFLTIPQLVEASQTMIPTACVSMTTKNVSNATEILRLTLRESVKKSQLVTAIVSLMVLASNVTLVSI